MSSILATIANQSSAARCHDCSNDRNGWLYMRILRVAQRVQAVVGKRPDRIEHYCRPLQMEREGLTAGATRGRHTVGEEGRDGKPE